MSDAGTTSVHSAPSLIHDYVDAVAERTPHHPSFEYLDHSLSYLELATRTNQLACQLIDLGIKKGDRVGIYMPKSIETPAALFGIMKAGAAYVPLDPSAPVERISGLLRDCDIRCIISSGQQRRGLKQLAITQTPVKFVIGIKEQISPDWRSIGWSLIGERSNDCPAVGIDQDDLAYIIYTSGSTGSPKGIMHTHRSGLCFSQWAAAEYAFTSSDRLSNHAPLHFDLSIMDYFSSVIVGATTVIVPEDYTKLPASYSQLIADSKITVLYTVPFALIQLLLRGALEQRDFSHLRYAIFGGEPFPPVHLRSLMSALPNVKFDNIYGPAEVNGVSHFTVVELGDDTQSVPIGPIADHAHALIVDENDEPVDQGLMGELLVCSGSMMQGYWRREELTESSLYRSPAEPSNVYYRTGDLVVVGVEHIMQFVGRKDRQVKVRGYRVELDEIELALAAIDAVEEGASYVVETGEGVREIRAEVTLKARMDNDSSLMRDLKKALPWYAVPSQLLVRREFPRGATGKIDRRVLQVDAQTLVNNSG